MDQNDDDPPSDVKNGNRNMSLGGKGNMKSSTSQGGNTGAKVIPKETLTEDDWKTQDLYKKFRGILNKLTPHKFDTLLEKVKTLNIDTQTRLEGVIDIVFEKAIDEPNFSEAYAAMCKGNMKSSTSQGGNTGAKVIPKETLTEDDWKTQDLYKKFRGILNKLTPHKFDTLLEKVKTLNIDTQTRLEGVIDIVFEKAIDEPNFSEAYAAMCKGNMKSSTSQGGNTGAKVIPKETLTEDDWKTQSTPTYENMPFAPIQQRPIISDTFMPAFGKGSNLAGVIRSNVPRDVKKNSRNMSLGGKGNMKSSTSQGGNTGAKVIPKETLTEDDWKAQDLYKKFRGILNKLTPSKFDTLLEKVKTLNIDTQTRLDLVFEKAIDEPNFSEAYAAMCNKLSMLKVPADKASAPNQYVNFRALITSKCQNQFVTKKVDEQVLKLEKEKVISECNDPNKKKELQLMLEEENRRARMRSVGNVRFIGELYKLKMLTSKIMVYCMNHLIEDVLEEENLECLCILLTTIREQVESEAKTQLDSVFEKMQNIIYDRKSNKISSRVRFMIQDVIELRKRRWVVKSVVDSQQQRQIELFNANPMGGFRNRNEGGRGKRGEGRRQNSNSFQMDNSNNWILTKRYTIDTSKSKAVNLTINKNLSTVKLAPPAWSPAFSTKTAAQISSNSMVGLTNNKYSVLEMQPNDSSPIKGSKDTSPTYQAKGASIERSTFTRSDFSSGSGSRPGLVGTARSSSGSRSVSAAPPTPPVIAEIPGPVTAAVPQDPLPENKKKSVHAMINLALLNPVDDELIHEIQRFDTRNHAAVVTEILNMALEKSQKEINTIAKLLLHLVSTNTILPVHFELGITETLEFAPDLYIDIPMLYEYLGVIIAPHIEKRHITLLQVFRLSENIKSAKQGHLLLKAIIRELRDSMGPTFAKSKWLESNLQFNQWMHDDQVWHN
ncbi:eukaryotic translation initiation factor 4 gamma 3-like [Achroia grisella]|uniref:eukaryotic translation initiation factor 4 gamma 3-like n=1 Tax=Achroia grisella TaxID=688607 RepID=UPI0027D2365C|nr:eukaryotic translation initiation factor 4 gamma 3-like [Achroia grisella]